MPNASEQRRIVSRARELANSGQFSSWDTIESSMRWANEVNPSSRPLDDFDLRRELDARCAVAKRAKAARTG